MYTYRYSRWDGSQKIAFLDADDLMDRLSDHIMSSSDLNSAMQSLVRNGVTDSEGRTRSIEELLRRLRDKRAEMLQKYDIDSVVGDINEKLDEIERLERAGIERRVREVEERLDALEAETQTDAEDERRLLDVIERVAAKNTEFLDQLPPDAAGKLEKFGEYEFMDDEARAKYQELVNSLRDKLIEHHFKNLSKGLESMDPDSLNRLTEMLKDLNRMLRDRADGDQPGYRKFLEKFKDLLGPNAPESLDDFAEQLQQQMAQMESLLNSMSPEMRAQLQELVDSLMQDEELSQQMAELARNLDALYPMRNFKQDYPFQGEDSITLDEALQLMERLQNIDSLNRQLRYARSSADLSNVDEQLVHEILGNEAVQHLEQLKGVVQQLKDAGYISGSGKHFELTPKGMRKIGQRALSEIFSYIRRSGFGSHATEQRGVGGEVTEETKKYEFGDTFTPHLQKTLFNAALRQASDENGTVFPLRLEPDDLEVYRSEHVSRASTVLMMDLSLSMAMRGNFVAAKKVALALHNLIRTRFPQDSLHIVGFSTYAREMKAEELPYLGWDEVDPYTNIQHGLVVAQKLLERDRGGTKQIIMVSDGEPTAHAKDGQLFLQYPPSPATLDETLKEIKRCASKGIIINTFMLDSNVELKKFVDKMMQLGKGRVFYTTPEHLGEYIVVDYLSNRRHVFR